jgi:23S rRNA pseudouridine2605 synthase
LFAAKAVVRIIRVNPSNSIFLNIFAGLNKTIQTGIFSRKTMRGRKQGHKGKKTKSAADDSIRLNKYIANSGLCSRREADGLIQAGRITVNNEKVTELGTKVKPTDDVRYKGKLLRNERPVYILLNKPRDYVTTVKDKHAQKTVMELIRGACPQRVYPVGRLDRNTTGVLLLTNDGELAKRLTHPRYKKKKVYHVVLDKPVTKKHLEQMADGIQLEDETVAADAVSYPDPEDKTQVGIEIHTGQNRVVRRMFEALGYRIKKLDRVYFAGLTKKNLKRGRWRFLTQKEISRLKMNAFQ